MTEQDKTNEKEKKGKELTVEKIKIGRKDLNKKLGKFDLESLVGLNKGIDQIGSAYEQGQADWDPDLRKQLGTLFYNKDNIFAEKGPDVIKDHYNYLHNQAVKKLTDKVEGKVDELIDDLDENQLLKYLYSVGPSKTTKEKYKELTKSHIEYLSLALLGQRDLDQVRAYLKQFHKDDPNLGYWLGGSDESVKTIYKSTLDAKEQELMSAFMKNGKKGPELNKKILKEYFKDNIKGSYDRIKSGVYKNLAYDSVKPQEEQEK
jgi:hypothetical protein